MDAKYFPESELIINSDGSAFHIHIRPDQLCDKIILVGDPGRVDLVASYFDEKTFEVYRQYRYCGKRARCFGKYRL